MKIVSARQMKEIDEKMIKDFKQSALSLMEKAGKSVADLTFEILEKNAWPKKVVLFAGKGNNGGDAFVAARLLEEMGVKTQTLLLSSPDEVKGEAKENLKKLKSKGAGFAEIKSSEDLNQTLTQTEKASIAIDGIVGTGSKNVLQGLFAEAAEVINSKGFPAVVSIDIPSGLDPNDGIAKGSCVRADYTVTMGLPKMGLIKEEGMNWTGSLRVCDLEIPLEIIQEVTCREFLLTPDEVILPAKRHRISHKGTYGHLLILGGSPGLTGAPAVSAAAGLRIGAGLVTAGIAQSLNPILEVKLTEAMTFPLPEEKPGVLGVSALTPILRFLEKASAVVLGPGLGSHPETIELIHQLLSKISVPMVLDADGLNAVSSNISVLDHLNSALIVTPHPGEMGRLIGQTSEYVQAHRWDAARKFSRDHHVITVLKGAGTVIADTDETLFINSTGNPGMAVGGMGDVLAGMIGGLLAQGLDPIDAAKLGVYLHGLCGDRISAELQIEQGLLASDLMPMIPKILKELQLKGGKKHEKK
jgi:hydroxyethylthiazole kinase-like uncharacterized protein yjeF